MKNTNNNAWDICASGVGSPHWEFAIIKNIEKNKYSSIYQTANSPGIAEALVSSVRIDAPPISTQSPPSPAVTSGALVLVHAEGPVRRVDVARGTLAHVRPEHVTAPPAAEADPRVLHALIHVAAGEPGLGRAEAIVARAPEGTSLVHAGAVGAPAVQAALVLVQALTAVRGGVEAGRAHALKAALSVSAPAPSAPARVSAFVNVAAGATLAKLEALVTTAGVAFKRKRKCKERLLKLLNLQSN